MTGNPGDVFHIKGIADERHYHDNLEQKISKLEILLTDLRAEWDEFIAANLDADVAPAPGLGRLAYDTYGSITGGQNFQGDPMPVWDTLPSTIKAAWSAAAAAVAARVRELTP